MVFAGRADNTQPMRSLTPLFRNNQAWAARIRAHDPAFFEKLSRQQTPDYLWIGCSDSRVPANEIVGLKPGELFVIAGDQNSDPLDGDSIPGSIQQLLDHPLRSRAIAAAEEVQVVEHVVEVVELPADTVAQVDLERLVVRSVEIGRETAEELCHREIGLTVPVVHRRVEDDRRALGGEGDVARPQVAVEQ